nr:putative VioE-like protein MarE [uncultured bacterium]
MSAARQRPPLLPERQWSSSYVSYWSPMQGGDRMTSGHVWYDYGRGVYRIDGVLNPWDEQAHGHLLWKSEINQFGAGECHTWAVAYDVPGEAAPTYRARPLAYERTKSPGSLVPCDVLVRHEAVFVGTEQVLGFEAEGWRYERPEGRGPVTYYFRAGTRHLLRMVNGDPRLHAAIRDFPTFSEQPIPDTVFQPHPWAAR